MKFKDGDRVMLTYDAAREAEVGPDTMVTIHGLDDWIMRYPGPWSVDRIGLEPAYSVTVLDPPQDVSPSHWCWEHELRRVSPCPMK